MCAWLVSGSCFAEFANLLKAQVQCESPTPAPPPAAAVVIAEEHDALSALQKVTADYLSPCPDANGGIGNCATIAADLKQLASEAALASIKLKYCAAVGKTIAGSALPSADQEWYSERALLWDRIAAEKQANAATFSSGYYVLPSAVRDSLSVTYNTTAVPAGPKSTPQDPADELENRDAEIRAKEDMCILKRDPACLQRLKDDYQDFFESVHNAETNPVSPQPKSSQNWYRDYLRLQNIGEKTPAGPLPDEIKSGAFAFRLGDLTGNVSHSRVITGVDVSASSSADPSAKFLLDAAIDLPLPVGNGSDKPIESPIWFWGYARLSSIAQPGPVSGVTAPTTYVQALTASSPNSIVQSFEASGGIEFLDHRIQSSWGRRPIVIGLIAGGGIITPISASQASPTVYVASPELQQYYLALPASNPSTINKQNASAISLNCPAPATAGALPPASPVCYVADYPTQRSRFFHNYSAGFRVKRYYYNEENEAFIFPANFDFTVGQNDYVTAGTLVGTVAHFGGATPISGFPGLYVYATFDLELKKNSTPDQQFILQTAPSSITATSANVASIFVNQPDRDRYRFGAGYDLTTLIKKLTSASK